MKNEKRERKLSHCNELPPLFFFKKKYMNQHPTLQPYHTTPLLYILMFIEKKVVVKIYHFKTEKCVQIKGVKDMYM